MPFGRASLGQTSHLRVRGVGGGSPAGAVRRFRQRGSVRTLLVRPAPLKLSEFTRRECSHELRRGVCTWECAERHGVSSWAAVGHAGLEPLSGGARLWNPLVSPSVQMSPPGDSAAAREADKCCIHGPSKMGIDSCRPRNAF